MLKQIIVPVAAFAVTATAANAFAPNMLQKLDINLTDDQVEALEEARRLHHDGDVEAAKEVLDDAGLDETILDQLKDAGREHRDAVQNAIETGDYTLFRELVTEGPLAEAITSEADFNTLVEAHQLLQDGDREGAEVLMAELGLERRTEGPVARGEQDVPFMGAAREALDAHDYAAFMGAVAGTPFADEITTEEQFDRFVEAHTLMEAGDREGARAIMEKLGIGPHGDGDARMNSMRRHGDHRKPDAAMMMSNS